MKRSLVSVSVAALLLAGCTQNEYGQTGMFGMGTKQTVGTVGGAVAGAALGNTIGEGSGRTVAIALGTLLGAGLGNSIGASLDRADMQYYNRTSQGALESNRIGQESTWRNPDSGNYGSVTPTKTYNSGGQVCREYTQTIYVGGKKETGFGRACRQSDGSWQIVE